MKAEHGQILCVMPNGTHVYDTSGRRLRSCACGLVRDRTSGRRQA